MKTKWIAYQCKACRGKGVLPGSEISCPICGGSGEMWNEVDDDE